MKKIYALILALIMICTLFAGCSEELIANENESHEGDVIYEISGDFEIAKIEAVAYAGGSASAHRYVYLATIKNEEASVLLEMDTDAYLTYSVGDTISGCFTVAKEYYYDTMKFAVDHSDAIYTANGYIKHVK